MASNIWTRSLNEFPQTRGTYIDGINGYIEDPANRPTRVSRTLRSAFDLSNNLNDGRTLSYGDFTNAVASCPQGGCSFGIVADGDSFTSFVSRFRGYINIVQGQTGIPLHFGFYADDAVSFVIYDRTQSYTVINRPPQLGAPTWRTTNAVTFNQSGLYAVEILYTQVTEHAALEMSLLQTSFADFERAANQTPVVTLSSAGFGLLQQIQFYQTDNGLPSYASDPNRCEQCNRSNANLPGNGGCGSFYYCNAAALCAPCNSSFFCGEACSPCGQTTPYCANVNGATQCVQCTDDAQCPNGRCDPADNSCRGCNDDADCPLNGRCDLSDNTCRGCNDDADCANGRCDLSDNTCRGCNDDADCPENGRCDLEANVCTGCNDNTDCPNGTVCDVPSASCVECTDNTQCTGGRVCTPDTHQCRECNTDEQCERGERCVDHACSPCNTNDSCAGNSCNCCPSGTQCAALTAGSTPSCVECTGDSQCANGQKCDLANGRCVAAVAECNTSDRCGPGCSKCPGERPYCLDGQVCVQCRNDLECGDGSYCLSGECASCTTDRHCGSRCGACGDDAPFCLSDGSVQGSACVGCRADADCGSGSCNATTHTCDNTGACAVSCEQGLVCDGTSCVQCFADAHCPCGGTCDLGTKTCSTSCDDSGDCLGSEFCSAETLQCERGRRKPGTEPQGGALCCGTTPDATPAGSTTMLVLLATGLLLLRSRRSAR